MSEPNLKKTELETSHRREKEFGEEAPAFKLGEDEEGGVRGKRITLSWLSETCKRTLIRSKGYSSTVATEPANKPANIGGSGLKTENCL